MLKIFDHRTLRLAVETFLGKPIRDDKPGQPKKTNRIIKSQLKDDDVAPLMIYFLVVAAVGLPLCFWIMITHPLPDSRTIVFLAVLGFVTYHLPVTMPSQTYTFPGFPLLMSALYMYGISAAVLVIVPPMLLYFFTRRHGLCNCLFNAGQFTLCLYTSEFVGLKVGWQKGVPAGNHHLGIICAMILAYDIINILFISGTIAITTKIPYWEGFVRAYWSERKAMLPQRMFLALTGILLASHMGNIAFFIIFVGVLSLRSQNIFQKELAVKTEEAKTDPLTGMYNMRYMRGWLKHEINPGSDFAQGNKDYSCSLIFADVDKLKTVNDEYGHDAGDRLLMYISEMLVANVRSRDKVARYGGDEFLVACPNTSHQEAVAIANRIMQAFHEKPFMIDEKEVAFGMSVGVASWPLHGETMNDIIRTADKAMYFAKKSGGNRISSAASL